MAKVRPFTLASICFFVLASVVFPPRGLWAQAMPTATGPGGYIEVGAGASLYQFEYGDRKLGGIAAWADVNPTWRYGLEGEVRELRFHTDEQVNETTFLGGPRISVLPGPVRPYVKLLVGAGHYNLPFGFAQGTFFTYAPGAGLDYILGDVVSIRVIDFEYQVSNKFQTSTGGPESNIANYGITVGINFRLNPMQRVPKAYHYKKRLYGRGPITE